MAINHEFQVVGKEVVFTAESPVSPFKMFTVIGDVLVHIVPIIRNPFSTEDAMLNIGEQGKKSILYMDSKYAREKEPLRPVSSDLYLTVSWPENEEGVIESGTVVYYCIFAPLSENGEVVEVD